MSVVWPEGEPENARAARSWFGRQWLMLGPFGFAAACRGRRMRFVHPVESDQHPVVLARRIERRWPA